MIWHGGMSFHGGMLGVAAAAFLFAKTWKGGLAILDKISVVGPLGLFFGRIANFINMEAVGRETSRPWGIVFANSADQTPRHASQLYEAGLEGIVLFAIMMLLWRTKLRDRPGALTGAFGIGYGAVRIFAEQFREPDAQLGFLLGTSWLTMGTLLSLGMIAAGIFLLIKFVQK